MLISLVLRVTEERPPKSDYIAFLSYLPVHADKF